MKNLIKIFVLFFIFASCEKTEDDTNNDCNSNCTTIRGKFISANNSAVPNIKIAVNYTISGGELGGRYTRKIVNTQSDQNGNFNKTFYIKDNELGNSAEGYFEVNIDDSKIDGNKYIKSNNFIDNTATNIGFAIYSITNRDTIIDETYYIPTKAFIKVNLNNFVPQKKDDYFEVQTLYPYGPKDARYPFLGSEYSTGFSDEGSFKAIGKNNRLNVYVAESEKNIIRVIRMKNGVPSQEDFIINVPPNNTIELTYDY